MGAGGRREGVAKARLKIKCMASWRRLYSLPFEAGGGGGEGAAPILTNLSTFPSALIPGSLRHDLLNFYQQALLSQNARFTFTEGREV